FLDRFCYGSNFDIQPLNNPCVGDKMTEPLACLTCQYWKRQRPQDNWGDCTKILVNIIGEPSHAVLLDASSVPSSKLRTRDIFFCEQYQLREIRQYTIVDAARDAARTFKEKSAKP